MTAPVLAALTPREREVLILIAEGHSVSRIAESLQRSQKTIESHRLSLGRKLKVSNRVELAKIAIAAGLVSIDGLEPERASRKDLAVIDPEIELAWLKQMSEALDGVSGQQYINALCNTTASVLGVRYSAVCISVPTQAHADRFTVALSERGAMQQSVHYAMDVTPVGQVIRDGSVCVTDRLGQLYPDDPFFAKQGLKSYLGLRLDGDFGADTAIYSIMHDQPLQNHEAMQRVMRFFLGRTSAELERIHSTRLIQELRARLDEQSD